MRFLLLFFLLLPGCATNHHYQEAIQSWQGTTTDELVKRWGQPDFKLLAPRGHSYYVYTTGSITRDPSLGTPNRVTLSTSQGKPVMASIPSRIQANASQLTCSTYFEINEMHRIVAIKSKGNNCIATSRLKKAIMNPNNSH